MNCMCSMFGWVGSVMIGPCLLWVVEGGYVSGCICTKIGWDVCHALGILVSGVLSYDVIMVRRWCRIK